MLNVEINRKEGIINVEASGSLQEMMADLTTLLNIEYEGLGDKEKQDALECCLKGLLEDRLYAKSSEEISNLAKEKEKERKKKEEEVEREIKDLFKKLADVLK